MTYAAPLRSFILLLPIFGLAACAPQSNVSHLDATSPQTPLVSPPTEMEAPSKPTPDLTKDVMKLKGLTPVQLRQVLGSPGFQRRDAPAEIWQYRGTGCTLDLFLYDGSSGQKVEHWAVRSPTRVNDSECLHQLVEQGRAGAKG